jgi:hypothetical protein
LSNEPDAADDDVTEPLHAEDKHTDLERLLQVVHHTDNPQLQEEQLGRHHMLHMPVGPLVASHMRASNNLHKLVEEHAEPRGQVIHLQ